VSTETSEPVVVDARGMRCPLPVILLARAAQGVPAGTRITVLSTDPAARYDVPAWARMRGHTIVTDVPERSGEGDVVAITVLLGSDG
jgi:tRNA 2-thiouridine synthesizing protein A